MRKGLITSILALTFSGLQAQPLPTTPKLVVTLTIDQLRTDYLEAFTSLYGEKGFKRLMKEGKVYSAYTNIIKQKAQVATAKMTSAKRASYNSIKLTWGKVSGASGYGIYRSTSEKGTYTRIGTVKGGSNLTYTDTKCSCGVTYYYKVAAYRTSGVKNYYGSN